MNGCRVLYRVVLGVAAAATMGAMAHAEVREVSRGDMTALIKTTPIELDAPFETHMAIVFVDPYGPQAEAFAQEVACGEGTVMGTDRAYDIALTAKFHILCGDFK